MFAKILAMGLVHTECSTKTRTKMYPTKVYVHVLSASLREPDRRREPWPLLQEARRAHDNCQVNSNPHLIHPLPGI